MPAVRHLLCHFNCTIAVVGTKFIAFMIVFTCLFAICIASPLALIHKARYQLIMSTLGQSLLEYYVTLTVFVAHFVALVIIFTYSLTFFLAFPRGSVHRTRHDMLVTTLRQCFNYFDRAVTAIFITFLLAWVFASAHSFTHGFAIPLTWILKTMHGLFMRTFRHPFNNRDQTFTTVFRTQLFAWMAILARFVTRSNATPVQRTLKTRHRLFMTTLWHRFDHCNLAVTAFFKTFLFARMAVLTNLITRLFTLIVLVVRIVNMTF